jgi:energy-coupling factor transport system permease protein
MKNLDPRVKLLWLLVAVVGIFSIRAWIGQLGVTVALTILIIVTARMTKSTFKSLKILIVFLPLTFLIHILFGTHLMATIFRGAPLDSWELLILMPFGFTLRIGNFILLMVLVTRWLGALEVLDAFYHILKPLHKTGLPVDDFFQIIFIAVRFIPLMHEEYERLDESWRIFINGRQQTLVERIDRIRTIIVPLMIVSFRRAEVLAEAMTVRGYNPQVRRTYVGQLHWRPADWALTVVGLGVLILTVIK